MHLTIPVDVQQEEISEEEAPGWQARAQSDGGEASAAALEQVAEAVGLLRSAVRPLVVAGGAAAYGDSDQKLLQFIEATRLPLMTEGDARGLVADDHPFCLGFYDSGLNDPLRSGCLGGYAEHVRELDELPGAIERAFDAGRPALLNVEVQRAISPRAEAAIARWKSKASLPF